MNDFELYVQKYAKKHGISEAEAKQHALVQAVEKHYEDQEKEYNKWW